jgi:hypothetical protein
MPPTVKEMFRWCRFLFFTNSTIGPIIRKKASYVLTDLIYSSKNENLKKIWKFLLEKILKIKEFELKMLLDLEVYGNAYCSIVYPFDRYLKCPHCGNENLMRSIPWEYSGSEFAGKCQNCGATTTMGVVDKPVRNRTRVKLIRWFPQFIEVMRNPLTGNSTYILSIPKWLKSRVRDIKINKVYVQDTPAEFLTAIAQDKNIEFDSENIFHMKNETISQEEDTFGVPPILNVMKDAWLYQSYKRAQEAICMDHVLPMTMISPASSGTGTSPHLNLDLASWQDRMNSYITQWRRDQNSIFTVPFPAQVNQVRGDAQALSVHQDVNIVRQNIAGGLDVPQDFVFGGLVWSGANVSLRVLENLLINKLGGINSFLEDWIVPKLSRFLRIPVIPIRHSDFKMADDVAQKNIALGLRQTNTISDQTTTEELGFDYDKEKKRRREEVQDRLNEMEVQQLAQADIQAKVMKIQARAQAAVQKIQMEEMQPGMTPGQQPGQAQSQEGQSMENQAPGGQSPVLTAGGLAPSPELMESLVNNFLKSTPPNEIGSTLNMIKETNPMLARAIEDKVKMIHQQVETAQPLPEQRPPRRGAGKAVI